VKNIFIIAVFVFCILSCKTTKEAFVGKSDKQEVVVISNDSIEYGVIIMDPGFESFLVSIAKPKWYYSEQYYKNKNTFYVTQWNIRVQDPFQYSASIYEQSIDYDPSIDYGLEVNYKLYNYFKFVEYKYKVKFF
jgi:hypothetical protein